MEIEVHLSHLDAESQDMATDTRQQRGKEGGVCAREKEKAKKKRKEKEMKDRLSPGDKVAEYGDGHEAAPGPALAHPLGPRLPPLHPVPHPQLPPGRNGQKIVVKIRWSAK